MVGDDGSVDYLVATPLVRTRRVEYFYFKDHQYVAKMTNMDLPTKKINGHIA